MKELSDKLSEAYSREELKVLCYELGLDPDELEEGTKSELIWQIITWCQRRGELANLIRICREQRSHILWPNPPRRKMTDNSQTRPSANKHTVRHKPLPPQTKKWILGLGVVIGLVLCGWVTITLANNFLADFNPTGQEPISVANMFTPHAEDSNLQGSEPSDTLSGPEDAVATIPISDLRIAGIGLEEIQALGHGGDVNSVAWSPDSKQLATASSDGRIRIWDVMTGQILHSLTSDKQGIGSKHINSVAWSPAGDLLLSGEFNAIRFWDAKTGEEVRVFEDKNDAVVVNWSPDGTRFAWGNVIPDASVHVWDIRTMQEQLSLSGHGHSVTDFAWSPDSTILASGGENNFVRTWNAATGAEIYILTYHTDPITGLAWSPDSTMLASVSRSTLRIIEANTGQQANVVEIEGGLGIVESVDWSSNGNLIAISNGREIWILDAQTGGKLYVLTGHTSIVIDVAWSPDSTMLASASSDDTVRIWRLIDSK